MARNYTKGASVDASILRQRNSTEERPNPLRAQMMDKYVSGVLGKSGGEAGGMSTIVKEIYRKNMDNRILNNLRQQINEMIEDPKGLFEVSVFKSLWSMYFKGEIYADEIYKRILPHITVIEEADGKVTAVSDWPEDPKLS